MLEETIIELELSLLKPEIRSSKQQLNRLLADDFLEIPSTGIPYNKSQALMRIPNEETPEFTLQDYQLRILSENLVQLIYKASVKRQNDKKITYSQRNSLWKKTAGKWQMVFHQGTTCQSFDVAKSS